ncbi:MAG TPA: hypothetical protein PKL09_04265 [bacterium]|nr:hypothetical protein [bacterium]HNS34403.1 hypothetical protein [bacterium]HNW09189.1 hypothetical protein [bacterium]HNZ73427.1 hypothetical protein [bacterium]HOH66869.1 hypothetical protein [bacterium]
MNRLFFLLILVAILISGCGPKAAIVNIEQEDISDCLGLCEQVETVCPNFLSSENCQSQCGSWDQTTKETIRQAANCQELSAIPEVVSALLPEINEPELEEPASECEAACNNYVNQCLTLVPNASQALFQDGLTSCLEQCVGWEETKVRCIKQSANCESMTNVCGL